MLIMCQLYGQARSSLKVSLKSIRVKYLSSFGRLVSI